MKSVIRNTQEELIMLKKNVLDKQIRKELKRKDVATLLQMHPNAVSRLKAQYLEYGIQALMPEKPGPKTGSDAINRTEEEIEDIVIAVALKYPGRGPIPLAEEVEDVDVEKKKEELRKERKNLKTTAITDYLMAIAASDDAEAKGLDGGIYLDRFVDRSKSRIKRLTEIRGELGLD